MPENRQYIKVKFSASDHREYTYHNDAEPVAEGEMVIVETKDGAKTVRCSGIAEKPTHFETKPIVGKAAQNG